MDHNTSDSEYSSAYSNSVLNDEGEFSTSVISYGNSSFSSYAESYGSSSIAMSKVNFSEIFTRDSDDSEFSHSQTKI